MARLYACSMQPEVYHLIDKIDNLFVIPWHAVCQSHGSWGSLVKWWESNFHLQTRGQNLEHCLSWASVGFVSLIFTTFWSSDLEVLTQKRSKCDTCTARYLKYTNDDATMLVARQTMLAGRCAIEQVQLSVWLVRLADTIWVMFLPLHLSPTILMLLMLLNRWFDACYR